ncbi:MAG: PQQ-dependent dehydrogenase, methanol/ethanol family [Rhizobiaceae bacterium]|nr:PQQ-dependent dehydrogenase, methanol/ethanol family [Rhizobiaceae bacterium]MCV0407681.1 PQQ-dependent dehydrogenase, methanol/ethanol family [Rhizobiaceae bacterium]
MKSRLLRTAALLSALAAIPALSQDGPPVTEVTGDRIVNADQEPGNWLSHGRTYSEQRYSPLDQITTDNVGELGLGWFADLPERRGIEATPIVVDGRMYVSSAWSNVYAFDAKTGEPLWSWDAGVPKIKGKDACCDVVNRGVAAWGNNIYVATIDGRLVALDAGTGETVWDKNTIDPDWPYTITGAPRAADGKIVIGNAGAELGVRGYVTAYDAETGDQLWRFYTVPGDPSKGFENAAMEMAAETWTGEWWKYGGGGTVWDSIVYDPEQDYFYLGVGNGAPWNRDIRSPDGGDNLFLSSIVAVKADTGEYVWHYQGTPGDTWDFTATQQIMMLDLEIDGEMRKTLVQAPKNGFFYVIDRTNGELISANGYVPQTWTSGIDMETGRPIETEGARYPNPDEPTLVFPSPFGGHNWHPMAYSPQTNLVYFSAQEIPFVFRKDTEFEFAQGRWNLGTRFEYSSLPEDPAEVAKLLPLLKGRLLAWDPVKNEEAFHVEHPGPWNGGVLATAGGLVFQGTPGGEFAAYDAANGDKLWSTQTNTGVVAGPVSYAVDGEQYIAVTVGWGTVFGLIVPGAQEPRSRVLVFRIGGEETLPASEMAAAEWPELEEVSASAEAIAHGKSLYLTQCFMCHGDAAMSGGVLPDLRMAQPEVHAIWNEIVLDGGFNEKGMPSFGDVMSPDDAQAIRQYILARAHATRPKD